MDIPLYLHLSIHFSLAVLTGYLAGRYFKNIWLGIIVGIAGGFLIDLDHALEYLLVYNWHFNLGYFFDGRQFLLSEKLRLLFHAWEYVPILLGAAYLFRNHKTVKIILITLALAGTVHLLSDVVINQVPLKFYSLSYRASENFEMKNLTSPAIYEANQELKRELGM